MAAIQIQRVERAFVRASVMTDTLHQVRDKDLGLLRMAVLLQRAVSVTPAVANTMTYATSSRREISECGSASATVCRPVLTM